jgi:regulator of sigma E protease
MATFITVVQFFAGLSLLIVLHELGHFLTAKYFGVRVEKFYLFFDFLFPLPEVAKFSLFKKKIGDTEYGIGWFPFGGYVQMSGIMDESMDSEALKEPVKDHEFRSKPAWQRLIILLGGIIVNILVAFVLYALMAGIWGDRYLKVEDQIHGLYVDSAAASIGLQNGDIITHVDGKKIKDANKVKIEMLFSLAENITYVRDGVEGQITGITKEFYKSIIDDQSIVLFEPAQYSIVDSVVNKVLANSGVKSGDRIIEFEGQVVNFQQDLTLLKQDMPNKVVQFSVARGSDTLDFSSQLDENAAFGFTVKREFTITEVKYNVFQAMVAGPVKSWETLVFYVRQFKLMFDPVVKGYRQIGGFGTIAKLYSGGFSWYTFMAKTAFLSIILAFMNLLPIPALDGGHAVFTIYEMIFRKPPNEKFMYYAQIVGMALLFGLLIYANGNDLFRAFFGK